MTFTVMWTLLPAGFTADGAAKLSLVASPRPLASKLGDSEVLRWPDLVRSLGTTMLVVSPGGATVAATVSSPPPEPELWSALFTPATPVAQQPPLAAALGKAESPVAVEAHALIQSLYREARDTGTLGRDHPVMQSVSGLNAWRERAGGTAAADIDELLDPRRITRERLRRAATTLRSRGHLAPASVVALVPLLRRLDLTRSVADKGAPPATRPAGPVSAIPEGQQADFNQVVAAILRHPALALRLGLRIDLTMPAFTGERLIRVAFPHGHPALMPWSAVVSNPAQRRFVMATEPDSRTELVNGMLDVRSLVAGESRHVVSDVDAYAVSQQLDLLAAKLGNPTEPGPFVLPPRRQVGFTLLQADRRQQRYEHLLNRNARFEGPFPEEVEGAPVLYADDVNTGYRVDVSDNGGPFRSLMRRVVAYTIGQTGGKTEFTVTDEGLVDAVAPIQQYDNANQAHLFIGEELFDWHGWALAAPFPGPAVGAEKKDSPNVVPVQSEPVPGYPLRVSPRVEPGSLTRLRFGHAYSFRVRSVDLAGHSIGPDGIDPTLVTPPAVYRRFDALLAPVVVPRRRFGPGESLHHLVVTSEGDSDDFTGASERHLAAPKTSQHLAELHRVFDQAFGKDVPQSIRDEVLEIARREEGSFLDPVVRGPSGPVPATGIAVVSTDPAATSTTQLPVPRGEPLAPGEYIVHDTPRPLLPYLPDAASHGFALSGLPGTTQPMAQRWTDAKPTPPWPARAALPARLVVRPAAANAVTTSLDLDRKVVVVDLAPAARFTVRLSSLPTPEALDVMDVPTAANPLELARKGQLPQLTPAQELTLVHAVRKPVTEPTLTGLSVVRPSAGAPYAVSATIAADSASTAKVALEATWKETIDRGYGPVTVEDRRVTIASEVFAASDTTRAVSGEQTFGDTKHRQVTYRGVSSSRFQEYFPPPTGDDDRQFLRAGPGQDVHIIARRRPTTPKIHSIVPNYRTSTDVVGNVVRVNHIFDGFRVLLRRPWLRSGDGELLGVVVATDPTSAQQVANDNKQRDLVTRWGRDPLYADGAFTGLQQFITPEDFVKPGPGSLTWQAAELPEVVIPGAGPQHERLRVVPYPVHFDNQRNVWRADVRFPMNGTGNESFVRLALVGFQPTSVPAEGVPDLRASNITVSDLMAVRASRTIEAFVDGSGPRVVVIVTTPAGGQDNPHTLRVRWQRREYDAATPDICVDATDVPAATAPFNAGIPGFALTIKPPPSVTGWMLESLLQGRLIVEELKSGWDLWKADGISERPVFTGVIELPDIL